MFACQLFFGLDLPQNIAKGGRLGLDPGVFVLTMLYPVAMDT